MERHRSGSAWTESQDTPQEARYSERAPSAPITVGARPINASRCSCRMACDGPAGAPDLSVTAGAGLGVGSSGCAHHPHLCSLSTHGLAHLSTDSGGRSPPARGLSIPLSGAASIRFCLDRHTGHSSESTLFRKCTFGAITGGSRLAAWPGRRPGWRPRNVRGRGSRSRDRL